MPFFVLFIIAFVFSYSVKAEELRIIGSVSKGTCSFDVDKTIINFKKPLQIALIKDDLNDKTYSMPFSIEYTCEEFDLSEGSAPFLMKVSAGTATEVDTENRIYPTNNITKAAFVLFSCDENKNNCNVVDINSGNTLPLVITANSTLQSHFEVSVIKQGVDTPLPGSLLATVDITLLQP